MTEYKWFNEQFGVKVGDRVAVHPFTDVRYIGEIIGIREDYFIRCRWDDVAANGLQAGRETLEHLAELELI